MYGLSAEAVDSIISRERLLQKTGILGGRMTSGRPVAQQHSATVAPRVAVRVRSPHLSLVWVIWKFCSIHLLPGKAGVHVARDAHKNPWREWSRGSGAWSKRGMFDAMIPVGPHTAASGIFPGWAHGMRACVGGTSPNWGGNLDVRWAADMP
ncbi:hypothetical protein B0H17DRAFT_1152484 [Mycena rosella]|uniref:Uncharacterized protein n=1 Tax=Mycena rosella TaxID=1033263 RepID=A0AAD7FDK9_MYCRO|nr:hypothetical protein B0H17DRAFT_1152484 [Mycena rosella]